MTGPEKTGLIYIKYTYLHYGTYLLFYKSYPISVSFIEFLRIVCIYDEISVGILCNKNELLNLKDQNLGQILSVDKTCFLRPGHICRTSFHRRGHMMVLSHVVSKVILIHWPVRQVCYRNCYM